MIRLSSVYEVRMTILASGSWAMIYQLPSTPSRTGRPMSIDAIEVSPLSVTTGRPRPIPTTVIRAWR